eukprot:755451-Rhodomonas_salina.1
MSEQRHSSPAVRAKTFIKDLRSERTESVDYGLDLGSRVERLGSRGWGNAPEKGACERAEEPDVERVRLGVAHGVVAVPARAEFKARINPKP